MKLYGMSFGAPMHRMSTRSPLRRISIEVGWLSMVLSLNQNRSSPGSAGEAAKV
jgi:hypothetical protein